MHFMLKRQNINVACYYKTAFLIRYLLLCLSTPQKPSDTFLRASTAPSAHYNGWLKCAQSLQMQPSMLTQPRRYSSLQESPQRRTENLRVHVYCTQKIVALLCFFCQQVTKADGHHPHYKYTTIFTLLAESGSRGTCCSPCSISASNTELWTQTARLQIQGKLPFPLQSLSFPSGPLSSTKQVCTCSCSWLLPQHCQNGLGCYHGGRFHTSTAV